MSCEEVWWMELPQWRDLVLAVLNLKALLS